MKHLKWLHVLVPFLFVICSLFFFTNLAQSAIVSGPDIISAPVSVNNETLYGGNPGGGVVNDHQQGFNEKQGVYLTSNLNVDNGAISAGTWIDSHMIFFNFADRTTSESAYSDFQTWTFSGNIIGVMSDLYGTLEIDSSPLLGAEGTVYPLYSYLYRGLEEETGDHYSINGSSLEIQMGGWTPGEWVRVITVSQVPIPASVILFTPAFGFILWLRRKAGK